MHLNNRLLSSTSGRAGTVQTIDKGHIQIRMPVHELAFMNTKYMQFLFAEKVLDDSHPTERPKWVGSRDVFSRLGCREWTLLTSSFTCQRAQLFLAKALSGVATEPLLDKFPVKHGQDRLIP